MESTNARKENTMGYTVCAQSPEYGEDYLHSGDSLEYAISVADDATQYYPYAHVYRWADNMVMYRVGTRPE